MAARQVFIVWSHRLFYGSVRSLLDNHPDIEVIGASRQRKTALVEIEDLQPDVVIIEEAEDDTATPVDTLKILQTDWWGLRVICMSLEDNELQVYDHEQRTAAQADDLLDLILEA